MPDDLPLRPATIEEIETNLSFALRYSGRKHVRQGDELMANITAERLVEHLLRSGFVVMKRPPAKAPSTPKTRRPEDR